MAETALEDFFLFFSVCSLMTCKRKITTPPGCQEDKFINICGELEHYNGKAHEKMSDSLFSAVFGWRAVNNE